MSDLSWVLGLVYLCGIIAFVGLMHEMGEDDQPWVIYLLWPGMVAFVVVILLWTGLAMLVNKLRGKR